jgi:hypothetical protein
VTDYAVTGKKGSGKSLYSVGEIRTALQAGRRVATNLDIHLDKLFGPTSRHTLIRLPDKPTVVDFEALGRGQEGCVEEENGIIVLDETSTFFNSRAFGDKERQPLLDWLVHSRKYGWDVYYICQGLSQIDKQLRETMIEYHVPVKRTDKWPIPFITPFARIFGLNVRFPKMHVGIVKHGVSPDAMTVDRRWYRAKDLYAAYDTQQIFLERNHPKACGMHTVLSAWHVHGRYLPKIPPYWLRFVYGVVGHDWTKADPPKPRPALKPKLPLVATLEKLPEGERLKHWRRLDALGAIGRPSVEGFHDIRDLRVYWRNHELIG